MRRRLALPGSVVLVTGAARGIGAETARLLAGRGATVVLAGLEPERLERLAGELGQRHLWVECDVTSSESLEAAVAATVERYGGLDVVLANAGISSVGTVRTTPVEALVRVLRVNLEGVVRTVHAALPAIVERRGHVAMVASTASFVSMPGMSTYAASKAGVEHFANTLRYEVTHLGVTVGSIHPGWIDTDLVRDVKADLPQFDEALRKMPGPLGATTSVEDCAAAIVTGIERRKRRVFVPSSIGTVAALRSLIVNGVTDRGITREAAKTLPAVEAEVARLGRYFGEHSVETR